MNLTPNSFGSETTREATVEEALGDGSRSAALRKKGLSDNLIAYIGRKKYGNKQFAKYSAEGRKRGSKK